MVRIKINYEWWEAVFEIDRSDKTIETMKDQILFWMSGEDRIEKEGGDIEKAYLKMVSQEMIDETMRFNLKGILSYFEDAEGYAPLNGEYGVKLISVDNWKFDEDDFFIEAA